jgi:Beta-lactamase class C and other penicillin binding proteins
MSFIRKTLKVSATIAIALFAALFSASCATAKVTAPDFSNGTATEAWGRLSDYVNAEIKSKNIKGGCAISIADLHGDIWSAGFGEADPAAHTPFAADTISGAGSVSKLFAATAIMKLVEAGKIDLDAPITTYVPELRPKSRFPEARPITVRDVMTHHSGLPSDYLEGFESGDRKPLDYPESFLKDTSLASSTYAANPPGRVLSYSNLSVAMLGIIVERLSDMSFEEYCQKEIFKPLGMKDSSFVLPEGFEKNPRFAKGMEGKKAEPIPYIRDIPSGALDTTARDLARFAASYLSAYKGKPGMLSPSTVRTMFAVQNAGIEADLTTKVGLNFSIASSDSLPGEFIVCHNGALPPFYSLFLMLPERGIAVSILCNADAFDLMKIASQSLRAAALATGQTPIAPELKKKPGARSAITAGIAGNYASTMGLIKVSQGGSECKVNLLDHWFDAVGHEDGTITLEKRFMGIKLPVKQLEDLAIRPLEFEGRGALALGSLGAEKVLAVRVDPTPIPEAWKHRFGKYVGDVSILGSEALSGTIGVDPDSGLMVATLTMGGQRVSLPLRAVSDTECVVEGLGRNLGETIEAVGNDLVYEGLRLKKK